MSRERELLQRCLRFLTEDGNTPYLSDEIRKLLAQPEQKIVCWGSFSLNNECVGTHETRRLAAQIQGGNEIYPLYTSPLTCDYLIDDAFDAGYKKATEELLKREPLSDEEVLKIATKVCLEDMGIEMNPKDFKGTGVFELARAIEKAHGIVGGE